MLWQAEQVITFLTENQGAMLFICHVQRLRILHLTPKETPDIIYLCFPNNPTGSTTTKKQLQEWVDYAK